MGIQHFHVIVNRGHSVVTRAWQSSFLSIILSTVSALDCSFESLELFDARRVVRSLTSRRLGHLLELLERHDRLFQSALELFLLHSVGSWLRRSIQSQLSVSVGHDVDCGRERPLCRWTLVLLLPAKWTTCHYVDDWVFFFLCSYSFCRFLYLVNMMLVKIKIFLLKSIHGRCASREKSFGIHWP